jgi:hypothetical protein
MCEAIYHRPELEGVTYCTYLAHRGIHVKDLFGCGNSVVSSGVCGVPFLPEELSTEEGGRKGGEEGDMEGVVREVGKSGREERGNDGERRRKGTDKW